MLIKGVRAYVDGRIRKCDILIKGELIVKIAYCTNAKNRADANEKKANKEIIDAHGLIAFPGLIDIHTHLREPGQEYKEDFLSGTKAALAGGYTLIYDMPNNMPKSTISKEALAEKKSLAKKALCEVRFHFGATENNFAEVRRTKPESMKIYLGKTVGNLMIKCSAALEHMKNFPKEKQIIVHAQKGKSVKSAQNGVRMAIELAKKANRKIHITHASSANEIDIAKNWKLATVDTAPHYLFLSKEEAAKLEPKERAHVNPPLRNKKEIRLMWKRLKKIDAIATDHAPHLLEDKIKGASGFVGLETALALFLDAHCKNKKKISLKWIAQRFSENPAKIMNLRKYGKIAPGFYANITLVDLKKSWVIKGGEFYSKAKWSPFEGRKLKGKVVKTIYKGKVQYDERNNHILWS